MIQDIEWKDVVKMQRWAGLIKTKKDGHKIPINPKTNAAARINDPDTLSVHADVAREIRRGRLTWKNLAITPDMNIVAIDIDGAREKGGSIWPLAMDIVRRCDTYTEWSLGDNGLHLFLAGRLDGGRDRLVKANGEIQKPCTREEADKLGLRHVEIYGKNHWMGVTWKHLEGTPTTIRANQDEIDRIASWLLDATVINGTIQVAERYVYTPSPFTGDPDEEEIRDALRHIPNYMAHADWVNILRSIYAGFPGERGIQIALDWCGQNSFKTGENPHKVLEAQWKSFARSSPKITLLHAMSVAEAGGWDKKGWFRRKMDAKKGIVSRDKLYPSPLSGALLQEHEFVAETRAVEKLVREAYLHGFVDGLCAADEDAMLKLMPALVASMRGMYDIGYDPRIGALTIPMSIPYDPDGLNIEFRLPNERRYQTSVGSYLACGEENDKAICVKDTLTNIEAWATYGHTTPHGWGARPMFVGVGEIMDDELAQWLGEKAEVVLVEFGEDGRFGDADLDKLPRNIKRLSLPFSSPQEAVANGLADQLFARAVVQARKL